jgi:hypothetical protein
MSTPNAPASLGPIPPTLQPDDLLDGAADVPPSASSKTEPSGVTHIALVTSQ